MTLLEDVGNARIYNSSFIAQNHSVFVEKCGIAYNKITNKFKNKNTTETYKEYNIFSIMAGCPYFFKLYKQLQKVIRVYSLDDSPLWMQAWLNYHNENEVLDWHNHWWPYHGYVSIDPHETITEFKKFKIINKIGNIYIGPGLNQHRVVVNKNFPRPRITLGFDVTNEIRHFPQMYSLIPI